MSIIRYLERDNSFCTGCSACFNICPFDVISMKEDEEGFLYPEVNHDLCRECGICERSCPSLNLFKKISNDYPNAYAYIYNDDKVRAKSSSGGCFHALAIDILKNGGVVFGAAFDGNWEVSHVPIETIEELPKLQVSKYVQSKIETSYQDVRKYLESGRLVLFCGTPCQCSGLQQYLNKVYDKLLLVDFICHGVPSPLVWRKYIGWRVNGKLNEIQGISFRDKNLSWEGYLLTFKMKKSINTLSADTSHDLYMKGFLSNLYLRPSCYECKFCQKKRQVDITLGDFWGVQGIDPEMFDDKGTSLVFIHSTKGAKYFNQISGKKKITNSMAAALCNPAFDHPATKNPKRKLFFYAILREKMPINEAILKFSRPPLKTVIKNMLKQVPGTKLLHSLLKHQ